MRLSPQMILPPAQHYGCIFLQKNIKVAWVARKKGIFVPSNLQIDNLIYGDGTQSSLHLRLHILPHVIIKTLLSLPKTSISEGY
jgi:hypothetical protein